jgi:hypothetical protein
VEICGKLGNLDRNTARDLSGELEPRTQTLAIRLCSACPGDYEDPDLTAGEGFAELLAEHEVEAASEIGEADA